jgi:hypothetical protein
MHPIRFSRTIGAHFVAAWLATVAVACQSPEVVDDCPEPRCKQDGATDTTNRRDQLTPPDAITADSAPRRSPLCGTTGCFPSNPSACGSTSVFDAAYATAIASPQDDAASDSIVTADAAVDGEAGLDGSEDTGSLDAHTDECSADGPADAATPDDASLDSGAPDAPEDAAGPETGPEASVDAGAPPLPDASTPRDAGTAIDSTSDLGVSDEPKITQSCYIKPASTGIVTACAPVGPGVQGSACDDSLECGPLLMCVELDGKPSCQLVICALPPECVKGTFYREAPLRTNSVTRQDIPVPLCVPTDNCTLLAPQNPCPSGKVCAVVGREGETTCLEPGLAKVGESCDETKGCAEGLLCSGFSNQCVKICHVDDGVNECPTGTCQGGNRSLPDGFGICVGQTDGG